MNILNFFEILEILKFLENDSHCRSIVLKTMDRSIVKQLEKEKNRNFNVENFVVMLIYWGTIIDNTVLTISPSFNLNISISSINYQEFITIIIVAFQKKIYYDCKMFVFFNLVLTIWTDKNVLILDQGARTHEGFL